MTNLHLRRSVGSRIAAPPCNTPNELNYTEARTAHSHKNIPGRSEKVQPVLDTSSGRSSPIHSSCGGSSRKERQPLLYCCAAGTTPIPRKPLTVMSYKTRVECLAVPARLAAPPPAPSPPAVLARPPGPGFPSDGRNLGRRRIPSFAGARGARKSGIVPVK